MSVDLRIIMIGFAAFAMAGLVAVAVVAMFPRASESGAAVLRARRLAWRGLLPAGIAVACAATVTVAFVLFEPRRAGEEVGVLIPSMAVVAALIIGATAWRWIQVARATRRLVRGWLGTAEPLPLPGITAPAFVVTSAFPIVAVIGLHRPRLIIARSVLSMCSPDELRAILAHEQGHIDRRDNLSRLLLSIAPVAAWAPSSTRLFAAWRDAAEEAADDDAARSGQDGRANLAAALIKVARIAPPAPREAVMPASALYRGESLERRVRRLLEPSTTPPPKRSPAWRTRLGIALAFVCTLLALETVHALVEVAIQRLP